MVHRNTLAQASIAEQLFLKTLVSTHVFFYQFTLFKKKRLFQHPLTALFLYRFYDLGLRPRLVCVGLTALFWGAKTWAVMARKAQQMVQLSPLR